MYPCSVVDQFPRWIVHQQSRLECSEFRYDGAWDTTCPGKGSEYFSGSFGVLVVQHPAETFPPMHFTLGARTLRLGTDQCIGQTLVVALAMVMRHEFSTRFPHRALAEQDHPLQAGFLDRPYKPFRVGVQIGTPRWKLH